MANHGILRQGALYIGGASFIGYIFFKATEGTDDDLYKKFNEDTKKEETNVYDKNKLMGEMLRGGGRKSLSELRDESAKLRMKIAEENTVYNIPVEQTPSTQTND